MGSRGGAGRVRGGGEIAGGGRRLLPAPDHVSGADAEEAVALDGQVERITGLLNGASAHLALDCAKLDAESDLHRVRPAQ